MSLLGLVGIHEHRRLPQYACVLRGVLERFEILNQVPALIVGKVSTVFVARIRVSGH